MTILLQFNRFNYLRYGMTLCDKIKVSHQQYRVLIT